MRLPHLGATFAAAALILQPIAGLAAGVDTSIIDKSIAPGDDFFGYANGLWLKSAAIPPDRASWGAGQELVEKTNKRLAELIAEAGAAHPAAGSPARQVADLYAAYMDEAAIEAKGLAPIRPALARIAAIADRAALARELGAELRADVDILNSTNLHTRPAVRPVGGAGSRHSDALFALPAAGRAGPSGPRLLPRSVGEDGGDPRRLPRPRRQGARHGAASPARRPWRPRSSLWRRRSPRPTPAAPTART